MVVLIPSWITITLFVFRLLRLVLGILAEVVLLTVWGVAAFLLLCYHLGSRAVRGSEDWVQETLRSIRDLPETPRRWSRKTFR